MKDTLLKVFAIIVCTCLLTAPAIADNDKGGGAASQERNIERHNKRDKDDGYFFDKERPKFDKSSERYKRIDERRERIKKELAGLSPEERKAKIEALRAKHKAEVREKIQKKFDRKWEKASAQERRVVCQKLDEKCQEHERHDVACDIFSARCASE